MTMRAVLITLLLVLPWCGQAAVYKWVDPDTGNVVYSDQPRKGAEQLELPEAQTYHAPPPAPQGVAPVPPAKPTISYSRFAIVSPKDKQTIRNTGGMVDMTLTVKPKLDVAAGHRISVVLDNKREYGPTKDPHFTLKGVVRGTHTLQALIKDPDGQVLAKTDPVTIYVKQHSRLHSKPSVPPM